MKKKTKTAGGDVAAWQKALTPKGQGVTGIIDEVRAGRAVVGAKTMAAIVEFQDDHRPPVVIAEKPALGKPVELGDVLPKGYQTASSEVGRLMPENIAEFRAYKNLSEVERRLLNHIAATEKDDAGEWVRVLCIKDCLAMAPGTPVLVFADDLRIVATRTARKPRDFGGQPVVDLEGFEHPYAMRLVYVRGRFARRIDGR